MDFEAFVVTRRPSLVRSAVLLGCRPDDAEDLVQVTLTRCVRHWRKVARADRPEAYVYRMLVNVMNDERSRRWHGELPTETLPEPDPVETDLSIGLAVRAALTRLSPEHREVLVLRFYADLSERETARALGVPAGTVKSRTARALAALSLDQNIARSH
ncbi:MAG: SigE family RNA polymerase sigma factor [Marmoricola sp.]